MRQTQSLKEYRCSWRLAKTRLDQEIEIQHSLKRMYSTLSDHECSIMFVKGLRHEVRTALLERLALRSTQNESTAMDVPFDTIQHVVSEMEAMYEYQSQFMAPAKRQNIYETEFQEHQELHQDPQHQQPIGGRERGRAAARGRRGRRLCRNGPSCSFLARGRCYFRHPSNEQINMMQQQQEQHQGQQHNQEDAQHGGQDGHRSTDGWRHQQDGQDVRRTTGPTN